MIILPTRNISPYALSVRAFLYREIALSLLSFRNFPVEKYPEAIQIEISVFGGVTERRDREILTKVVKSGYNITSNINL